MSNIGRKPIELGPVDIEIKDNMIHYKGPKTSGIHTLPSGLSAEKEDKKLYIIRQVEDRDTKRLWGLHRALIANAIEGSYKGFEKQLKIVGLGYKAVVQNAKIQFSLGYSHKIDFELPEDVQIEVDKTGQLLTFRSSDKVLLGLVCSHVKSLRPPEPYKGTGIHYVGEQLRRKAGKAKAA